MVHNLSLNEFEMFVRENDIRHGKSAPIQPASNGAAERVSKHCKTAHCKNTVRQQKLTLVA